MTSNECESKPGSSNEWIISHVDDTSRFVGSDHNFVMMKCAIVSP